MAKHVSVGSISSTTHVDHPIYMPDHGWYHSLFKLVDVKIIQRLHIKQYITVPQYFLKQVYRRR